MPTPTPPTLTLKCDTLSTPVHDVDLSRGARHLGLRPNVIRIESEVLDDYAELDNSIGQNTAGTILSVLGCELAVSPGGVARKTITVCLVRREDATVVELDLHVNRVCHHGNESLYLHKAGERVLDLDPAS